MPLTVHRLSQILLILLILSKTSASPAPLPGLTSFEPDPATGTSTAIIVADQPLAYTSQLLPSDTKTDAASQAKQVLQNLDRVLKAKGSGTRNIAKLNIYISTTQNRASVAKAITQAFSGPVKPAVSYVTTALPDPNALVAMDAVALLSTNPQKANSQSLPSVQGVKSMATLPAGPKLFVSGMADTNNLPDATLKTLEKLSAALAHLNLGQTDIIQLKAFFEPMSRASEVREQITHFFGGQAPPLVMVEWSSPPPNPPIEIELVASGRGDFSHEPDSVSFLTPPGTTSTKVFSRIARVNHGKLMFFSGLYAEHAKDAAAENREIFQTLAGLLPRVETDFEHLVKATYYVTDDNASNELNKIRPQFFNPQRPPAASKAKVKAVGLEGASVMVDMLAVTK
jgi:enamine deaminase RidA (YjgF/YER057c/UK114 family)